jgi:phenylalanyl-tRNA synthetase beta chain
MKFSERWLRTMVDPPVDTATLAESLTMAGFEVESIQGAAPRFGNVVVGRIEAIAPASQRGSVARVHGGRRPRRTPADRVRCAECGRRHAARRLP